MVVRSGMRRRKINEERVGLLGGARDGRRHGMSWSRPTATLRAHGAIFFLFKSHSNSEKIKREIFHCVHGLRTRRWEHTAIGDPSWYLCVKGQILTSSSRKYHCLFFQSQMLFQEIVLKLKAQRQWLTDYSKLPAPPIDYRCENEKKNLELGRHLGIIA